MLDTLITDTRVYPCTDTKNTIGYADITIADRFIVKNLRIVKGKKGIFLGMPAIKNKKGEYYDVFFPKNQKTRQELTDKVLQAFQTEYPKLLEDYIIFKPDNR